MKDKEKAQAAWQGLTAVLTLKKEAGLSVVHEHLLHTPKPHVTNMQFVLIGSGFATAELIPDGEYGPQSQIGLAALYAFAHND